MNPGFRRGRIMRGADEMCLMALCGAGSLPVGVVEPRSVKAKAVEAGFAMAGARVGC